MTMLSFRVPDDNAAALDGWAVRLAVDRSELLREALRAHLVRLAAEDDVEAWQNLPLTPGETTLAEIADWGPAEDWKDWSDGQG